MIIRFTSIVVFFVLGAAAYAQESSPLTSGDRNDFVSDASFFIGTFVPEHDRHSAEEIASAGQAFVAALGDKFRTRGVLNLDDGERKKWTNLPPQPSAGGVRLGELNKAQLKATCDLLATLLSKAGYEKACQIMLGDDQLLSNGQPQQGFGVSSYAVMVFGVPSAKDLWGFQLDGHHLALNVAIRGADVTMSPSFIGAQPEQYEIAGRKFRPFANEVDDAFALIELLTDEQRIQAVTRGWDGEIVTGPGQDGIVPQSRGVPCSSFDEKQRQRLLKLISNWIGTLPPSQAERRTKQITDEIDAMHFAWNGEVTSGSDISYSIQSPSLIIEFSCQRSRSNPYDHLHSMYRDPTNEYGSAWD